MIVLIITHSGDNESVESVARAVAERGGSAVRLDTDRFPSEVRLAARYGGTGRERVTFNTGAAGGDGFDLGEVGAVWHRRLSVAARLPRELDAQLRAASVGESRAALLGVLAGLTAFRVDPEQAIRRAEQKPLQLRVARELGLEVPRTLVTNDPAAVREFYAACDGRARREDALVLRSLRPRGARERRLHEPRRPRRPRRPDGPEPLPDDVSGARREESLSCARPSSADASSRPR